MGQKDQEEAEVQQYIAQFKNLTSAQLENMLLEAAQFTPNQEQDLPLQNALVFLLEQTDPAPQEDPAETLAAFIGKSSGHKNRRRPHKRLFIVAAVIAILLLLSAVACAVQHWGLFLNIRAEFTQPRTVPDPEATVETWRELPIPTYTPSGFYISDAASGDGTSTIEYTNSEGRRFSVFYYSTESSVLIDSEKADQSTQFELEHLTVHLLEKNRLTTLYWNEGPTIVSIEFHPEEVSLDEVKALALSMAVPV